MYNPIIIMKKEFEECKKTWYYFIFDNDNHRLRGDLKKIQRRLSDPYLSVDEVGRNVQYLHTRCIKVKEELNVD